MKNNKQTTTFALGKGGFSRLPLIWVTLRKAVFFSNETLLASK
jgi:hypothetical protein